MTRYMIFPYTQNSAGAIDLAAELEGQRILREGSTFVPKASDCIINWGASDCIYPQALNADNKAVLNKRTFFQRLAGKGVTPEFRTTIEAAIGLGFPVFCRTKLNGRDGAGIVVADSANQIVQCDLYVKGMPKTAEYRIHVGRRPDGTSVLIGAQKKIHGDPHPGQDGRVWTGESTRFVWTVDGQPAYVPPGVREVALEAFDSFPELTFGAFDVIYNAGDQSAYVLEINSAPMMTPKTAKIYGDFFRKYVELRDAAAAQVTPQPPAPAPVAEPAPQPAPALAIEPALSTHPLPTEGMIFQQLNAATGNVLSLQTLEQAAHAVFLLLPPAQ